MRAGTGCLFYYASLTPVLDLRVVRAVQNNVENTPSAGSAPGAMEDLL